ncbi:MAG: PAS domain S-box protein [Geobacteraceae bacterium]|nr:PAS domain S-box protein [Geobacteraceae bacterium]
MLEKKKNLAWLIFIRLVVVSLFLASITYFNIRQPDFFPDVMLRDVTRLIIVTYLFSILSLTSLRFPLQIVSPLGYAQIIWESLFVSILVVITGGISSTYPFLFNLAIINASYLFGRREALYTAGICGIIYGSIIDLHYFGKLENIGLMRPLGNIYGPNFILSLIFTNLIAFFLTAILTGYLAERARKSETALKEKEIDYEELQRLNSIIVETLDSGLVTLNSHGKIRVFNRYISQLTGVPQKNAYDMEFAEIFPEFCLADISNHINNRIEISYTNSKGDKLSLSLKYAPLFNNDGERFGAVIDVIDMTERRDMEAKLMKSDRLAAIGELSARIAHEVRNPLASISGSVQLIAESAKIPLEDKKLIEIVIRETSRLDSLVTEFLNYARPRSPQRSWFSLNLLIDDLIALLKGDVRFFSIIISLDISEEIQLFADRDQLHQVLWNLILNAAESMPEGGEIFIGSWWGRASISENYGSMRTLNLTIKDTGFGIKCTDMSMIFEPFFTTKPGGSGLGLATVYRILEAHSGTISVDNEYRLGTSFTISIPVPLKV